MRAPSAELHSATRSHNEALTRAHDEALLIYRLLTVYQCQFIGAAATRASGAAGDQRYAVRWPGPGIETLQLFHW